MDNAVDHFNGKKFSYVYDNGWEFTNFFQGNLRVSEMEKRGVLRETVEIASVGMDCFVIAWVDEEMGPITQYVDFSKKELLCTVFYEEKMQIWKGKVTEFENGTSPHFR